MKEINRRYDPVRLSSIKRMLLNETKEGNPRYYEIWVDDVKMVEKTNDAEKFNSYEDHVFDETEKITVNVYTSSQSSPHIVTRYNFTFGEDEPKAQAQPMNGFGLGEIEARINEKVSQERERWDCEQVKRDLASLKEKLKESEEWNEKLEVIIEETKKKLEEAKGLSDLTSIVKDLAVSKLLGKKPEEKQSLSGSEKPQEEASFKMKSSEETPLTEQEKNFLQFRKSLEANFSEEEFGMVLDIIDEFIKDKTNIKPVTELLNINPQKTKE
jgi:hypothetical protein